MTTAVQAAGVAGLVYSADPQELAACGDLIIYGLLDLARRRDLWVTALVVRNSGDTHGPRDRVVGYGSFALEYAHAARLDDGARKTLFDLAREVVRQAALHSGKPPNVN